MTEREALEQLRSRGYRILHTNADEHEISDYLSTMDDDGPEVSIQPGVPSLDGPWALRVVKVDDDGYRETGEPWLIARMDLEATTVGEDVLTSPEAAAGLGVDPGTTKRAAASGQVPGARREPRPGTINAPWVATRAAWQEWHTDRRPSGRPKRP